jgi:DeoR/GlpR family transcriptional regulator of sugar metabolism
MFPDERYEKIIQQSKVANFTPIEQLCKLTNSSEATIRRDIIYLSKNNKIRKARGGILSVMNTRNFENSFGHEARAEISPSKKERIGIAAQQLIKDRDIIVLHSGTTCEEVAKNIADSTILTVITNGLEIVSALRNKRNVEVIFLGGKVDYVQNMTTGPMLSEMLEKLNPNMTIMGAGGISDEKGITNYSYIGSIFEREIVKQASELIFVIDDTKFGKNVLHQLANLQETDVIITNKEIDPIHLKMMKKHEIRYVLA